MYIANCYVVPENSLYLHYDPFGLIHDDIVNLPNDSFVLLAGDYNAHTNNENGIRDHIPGTDSREDNNMVHCFANYICEIPDNMKVRSSLDDRPMNNHGKCLIELCKATDLIILNGRIGEDAGTGRCTHFNSKSHGVLDYMLASPLLLHKIKRFKICEPFPDSDHAPLELKIACTFDKFNNNSLISPHVWEKQLKYVWQRADLCKLKTAITDFTSMEYRNDYTQSLSRIDNTDLVAKKFDSFISQACQRVFHLKEIRQVRGYKNAKWFDTECKHLRALAIQAGERMNSDTDKHLFAQACKAYRSCKQRKKREYRLHCVSNMDHILQNSPSDLWKFIDRVQLKNCNTNEPSGDEFYQHFDNLTKPIIDSNFEKDYEKMAKTFLDNYVTDNSNDNCNSELEHQILNDNFTCEEIVSAIDSLKTSKSPGADCIPPEFIKMCKIELRDDITNLFNYILEKREFPERWAEGIKSAIHKKGDRLNPNNYRGISVPKIFEKLFEIVVHTRLQFINEAFGHIDETNGGFLKGRRTSDNAFILRSLIQKQLLLGKRLYVCFVDFSSAFDLVNRHILFYKLMTNGWKGRLIDTLRDLYNKTHFRIKKGSTLSPIIENHMGVNQGGNASGFLFRKYMADLSDYLKSEFGVTIGNRIIAHVLWADDLILLSDEPKGIVKQLGGLKQFCKKNQTSVNQIKTKLMVFGSNEEISLEFNDSVIQQVDRYKYVGFVIKSINRADGDPFKCNYSYLCDQARKALFGIKRKLKILGKLPPKTMFYVFNTLIKPIVTYGSDVWGINKGGRELIDKVFLKFMKQTLGIKQSTSTLMVYGETGQFPPSIDCIYNTICFLNRIACMNSDTLVRQAYEELNALQVCGFQTWCGKAWELMQLYGIPFNSDQNSFKKQVKCSIRKKFVQTWSTECCNLDDNPIMRTYSIFKQDFGMELYLHKVSNFKYRQAISKLRTSSHDLTIEKARHCANRIDITQRLCPICGLIEDEIHFLVTCHLYSDERKILYQIIGLDGTLVQNSSPAEIFCHLMKLKDQYYLEKLGQFIYTSFKKRNQYIFG